MKNAFHIRNTLMRLPVSEESYQRKSPRPEAVAADSVLLMVWTTFTCFANQFNNVYLVHAFGEGSGTPLQCSCLENPMEGGAWWAAVHGVAKSRTWLSDFTFTFHFHALEKEMATHSSVLAWRIPGTGGPPGLPSVGLHRVGHDWSDSSRNSSSRTFLGIAFLWEGVSYFTVKLDYFFKIVLSELRRSHLLIIPIIMKSLFNQWMQQIFKNWKQKSIPYHK